MENILARRCLIHALAVTLMAALTACGGSGVSGGPSVPVPPPAPAPSPTLGNTLPGPRPTVGPATFAAFESGQVRPLALSADKRTIYAVNTPDNRLEMFTITDMLSPVASVRVGLEPVAVAVAPNGHVWVVNHLSDSVSVVDPSAMPPRIVQTLWVGDEPRDIVFAGPQRQRAFVTTAHRGQNSPVDPQLTTPAGRADVWVFDADAIDDTPGGRHEQILTLFGDRPRPLAVSGDGQRVYAGVFLSGNRTTVIAPNNFDKGAPTTSADGIAAPDSGLIVRFNGGGWRDHRGQNFDSSVPFSLPDYDVFEIDAVALTRQRRFRGVGTVLFNMVVNPVNDAVYVSNHESRNHVRFAGVASRAPGTVRGHVTDPQITVIGADGTVAPRRLNTHLDFSQPEDPAGRALSLAAPMDLTVSADGTTLYVTAFGSNRVGIYDTAALEAAPVAPQAGAQVFVTGGGPSGIVLDEQNDRAFVLTRFDNGISTISLSQRTETAHVQMFNPEPPSIVSGRKFLYDATITSGNGNDSCASCHVFGDTDGLAWDLGEPDATVNAISNVFIPISPPAEPARFHPMKGPMTTQSMRGLTGHGPMHWRGDRAGSERVGSETLEEAAFKEFNEAFDAFAALGGELSGDEMQAFTDFSMQIRYPPNPIRALDNTLDPVEVRGEELFRTGVVRIQTGVREICRSCHTLNVSDGLFGTKGLMSDNSQPGEQNFKIPHFRDQYQKVGMFGWGFNSPPFTGPQIRGFSFNHNGATSSNFILADLGMPGEDLAAMRAFLYGFPTESPPVTGQQLTLSRGNLDRAADRLDLLVQRGLIDLPLPECDLVVSGVVGGVSRAWALHRDDGLFWPDSVADTPVARSELTALLQTDEDRLTFLCVPWGSGQRIGLDRDLDGVLDRD